MGEACRKLAALDVLWQERPVVGDAVARKASSAYSSVIRPCSADDSAQTLSVIEMEIANRLARSFIGGIQK
jgi:hypothetical protein